MLVKRANPVLRDVDRLFGILTAQSDELAQLAADSETILEPLARERQHVAGFLSNSGAAGPGERRTRRPNWKRRCRNSRSFLTEFKLTMRSLEGLLRRGRAGASKNSARRRRR